MWGGEICTKPQICSNPFLPLTREVAKRRVRRFDGGRDKNRTKRRFFSPPAALRRLPLRQRGQRTTENLHMPFSPVFRGRFPCQGKCREATKGFGIRRICSRRFHHCRDYTQNPLAPPLTSDLWLLSSDFTQAPNILPDTARFRASPLPPVPRQSASATAHTACP